MSTPNGPINNGYFDMGAIFKVQQNYLLDLSNSYPGVNNAPLVATYVHELQDQMRNVAKSYEQANTSSSAVLTQQQQMVNIINAEQQRLMEKKNQIDQASMQEQRIALLNNSYRLRYAQYTKIMIVFIIGLAIHIVLRLLSGFFEQIPTFITVLLHIANIVICGAIIIRLYADIQMRDQINFNQIVLPPPIFDVSGAGTPASANFDNLWGGFCYGQECCGPNTVWNSDTSVCDVVVPPTQAVTTGPISMSMPNITTAPITTAPITMSIPITTAMPITTAPITTTMPNITSSPITMSMPNITSSPIRTTMPITTAPIRTTMPITTAPIKTTMPITTPKISIPGPEPFIGNQHMHNIDHHPNTFKPMSKPAANIKQSKNPYMPKHKNMMLPHRQHHRHKRSDETSYMANNPNQYSQYA